MPLKYFQMALMANNKKVGVEKLQEAQQVHSLNFEGSEPRLVESTIKKVSGIFPKTSWMGFKVSWDGGFIYGTEDLPLVLSDGQIIPVKLLKVGEHALLGEDLKPRPITLIEKGKVMCGRKTIVMSGTEDAVSGHVLNVASIWVGDQILEEKVKEHSKVDYGDEYIYPGNVFMRTVRRTMMALMGEKE